MPSPITVLSGNIIESFEKASESSLAMHLKAVSSGQIKPYIDYDNGNDAARGPHADLSTKRIYLQETYLEYLWAFIYSVFVMYEEGIQKRLINQNFSGSLVFDTEILQRAKALYDWSISLADKKSNWDVDLPNPQKHLNDLEKVYTEKVNGIFSKSISYVLFHEFCHLTQGHQSYFLGVNLKYLTEADYADRIQLENEADEFAFNMIVDSNGDEKSRWIIGLSVLFATSSTLLLTRSAGGIKQRSHPDLDTRLHTILEKLDLQSGQSQFYCWYLCCFAVNLYLLKHGVTHGQETYDTAEDCFFGYLEKLDEIKMGESV